MMQWYCWMARVLWLGVIEMPTDAKYGLNRMLDPGVVVSEASAPWAESNLTRSYDTFITGWVENKYGSTGGVYGYNNNGRGLTVTFPLAIAANAINLYGFLNQCDASIQYWDESSWIEITVSPLISSNAAADGSVLIEFNDDGAVKSKKWRWEIKNWDNYNDYNNFYGLEVEIYVRSSVLQITLAESIAATDFLARTYDFENGAFVFEQIMTAGINNLYIPTQRPVLAMIMPNQGNVWKPSTAYVVNDLIFPRDPIATPHYYKRLINGASGATEPTWAITGAGQCDDGIHNNAWERVDGLAQPITIGPMIPS